MIFLKLRALKLEKARLQVEQEKLKLLELQLDFCPHRNIPVRVYRDGSRWVCSLESAPEPTNCVTAYGSSPQQACTNFDHIWNGTGFALPDQEEEEEEQF
jgi:hypothetical protein